MANAQQKVVHRTANGKEFNMDQFRQKNELAPAVGNIKVNARGDELGRGGKIIKKRSEVLDEYYKNQTKDDEIPVKMQEEKPKPTPTLKPPAKPTPTTKPTAKSTATKSPSTDKGDDS